MKLLSSEAFVYENNIKVPHYLVIDWILFRRSKKWKLCVCLNIEM